MRIFQINTADTKGGAGKVAYSLKNGLQKFGHQSSLLVSRKYAKNDKDVFLIRSDNNLRRKILKKVTHLLADDLDFFPSNHVLKMPQFKNADIVHCHNLHTNYFNLSALIKISALKPIIWTFHDMWPITAHCAHAFDGKIKENGFFTCPSLNIYPPILWHNEKYLEKKKKKIYTNSNFHIVTPSKWLAEKVSQSILKDKPLTVIYNGVDAKIFRPLPPDQCRHNLGLPQNKKIILVIAKRGQSNPWKGGNYAQELVDYYKNKEDVCFVNLGGDKDKISGNTISVAYVSDEKKLAEYYSAADVLLYPSVADNCPLVVLEAQACGLPVVSFRTGGIPELFEHKNTGYIADHKDASGLIAGVDHFLEKSESENETIKFIAAKNIAEKFTIERMVDQYIKLYEKLKTPPGVIRTEPLSG